MIVELLNCSDEIRNWKLGTGDWKLENLNLGRKQTIR